MGSRKRIVLQLSYDGSGWQGWQTQPHHLTIQDRLLLAISRFCPSEKVEDLHIAAAGRTDAGVHATCQVVHFDTNLERKDWARGLNSFLPDSISVVCFFELDVNSGFHARFSAKKRSYTYLMMNTPNRVACFQKKATWFFRPLNADRMQTAASYLLGKQDFSCFRAAQCQSTTPIKEVFECSVKQKNDWILVSITANAFLHHMVRNIVSALVEVGSSNKEPEWIKYLIEQKKRQFAPPTFPAEGLYLTHVEYDDHYALELKRDLLIYD